MEWNIRADHGSEFGERERESTCPVVNLSIGSKRLAIMSIFESSGAWNFFDKML
jgi:hypothetical protein